MITLGIDLSSMPKGTAACLIKWESGCAVAEGPALQCTDEDLDALIGRADVVGIDAPFGWPTEFVAAVAGWTAREWSANARDRLQFRETDFAVRDRIGRWPLSVSTDRIALPAMRAMALLHRHGVTDKSGGGRFFEVYPAGSLFCWNLRYRGYKRIDDECASYRKEILNELRAKMSWLEVSDAYAESSDSLDALVASLTARAAAQGQTSACSQIQLEAAKREGWIHLPKYFPTLQP
jgi:predicted nuclease with RNAse H fold